MLDSEHFKCRSGVKLAMAWPRLVRSGSSSSTSDTADQRQPTMFDTTPSGAPSPRCGLLQIRMPHEQLLRRYWTCALDPLITGAVITSGAAASNGEGRCEASHAQRLRLTPTPRPRSAAVAGRAARMQQAQKQLTRARAQVSTLLRLCRAIDEHGYVVGRKETALSARAQGALDRSIGRVRALKAKQLQAAVRGHLGRPVQRERKLARWGSCRIQAWWRGRTRRQEFERCRRACTLIAALHRGNTGRQHARARQAQTHAATRIQACQRGRLGQQQAHDARIMMQAAIHLQSCWRRFVLRVTSPALTI